MRATHVETRKMCGHQTVWITFLCEIVRPLINTTLELLPPLCICASKLVLREMVRGDREGECETIQLSVGLILNWSFSQFASGELRLSSRFRCLDLLHSENTSGKTLYQKNIKVLRSFLPFYLTLRFFLYTRLSSAKWSCIFPIYFGLIYNWQVSWFLESNENIMAPI